MPEQQTQNEVVATFDEELEELRERVEALNKKVAAAGPNKPAELPPEMELPRDLPSFLAELSAEELVYLKDGLHQILRSIRAAKILRRLVFQTLEEPVERFKSNAALN